MHGKTQQKTVNPYLFWAKEVMSCFDDFAGTVIVNRIMGIGCKESADSWHLHVGAGENWHHLVQYTLEKGCPDWKTWP